MTLNVLKPGLLTTIQDLGRYGYQNLGVNVSGAMDSFALRLANLLIGNNENDAGIEMTMLGGTFHFDKGCLISICGGDLNPIIDGQPVSMWRPIWIKKGAVLTFSHAKSGIRTYLAVSGGFALPKVMESKSTHLKAQFGGFQGRALEKGDQLLLGPLSNMQKKHLLFLGERGRDRSSLFQETNWSLGNDLLPNYSTAPEIRIILHSSATGFKKTTLETLLNTPYLVTPQSDRMGYRLKGNQLECEADPNQISEPVQMGTIQVPPDGQPIILMADRQTTGGYPIIGHVITPDLGILAQTKPGDHIHFRKITLSDAHKTLIETEKKRHILKRGLSQKWAYL